MSPGEQARRVCLLTGASGTLGSYFCARYGDDYDIAGVYLNRWPPVASQDFRPFDPLADQAVEGRPIFAVQADLSAPGAVDRVVHDVLTRFGRIDLLVNCAVASTWAPMLGSGQLSATASHQMVVNTVVPLQLATAVATSFWQGRDDENRAFNRNVVNVSSVAAMRIYTGSGQSVYAASKAALNHLTGHMAVEFAAVGIRVNATAPNSFPSLVSTERAAASVRALDQGTDSGTVVVVDGDEDSVVALEPYATRTNG